MEEKKTGILDKIRQKRKELEEEKRRELIEAGVDVDAPKPAGRGDKAVDYTLINPNDAGYKIDYKTGEFKKIIKENGDKILHNITVLARKQGIVKDRQLASLMQLDVTALSRYRSGNLGVTVSVVANAALGLDVDIRSIFDLSLENKDIKKEAREVKTYTEQELQIIKMTERMRRFSERELKFVNYVLNYIEGN